MADVAARVVLIDDHGLCRRGLAELLEHRGGIRVVGATGEAEAAVRLVRELGARPAWSWTCACPRRDGLTLLGACARKGSRRRC